jgi:hypothetical protein
MIARFKREMALRFKKFLLVLAIALIFEPLFLAVDRLADLARFGEASVLWEKLLEAYLVLYWLFVVLSRRMGIAFESGLLYGYLLQALVLKFIYQRFFKERVMVLCF